MKRLPAFTLIEVLIVIAIIGLLTFGGYTAFVTAKSNQELSYTTDHLVDTLRRGHIFSRDLREDKEWGVDSQNSGEYRILIRTNPTDPPVISSVYAVPRSIRSITPFELWFGKGTGEIDVPVDIVVENSNGQQTTIRVEKTGVISYETN